MVGDLPATRPKVKINEKQLKFCREYVVDLNATQAAIRAGYSPRTAQEQSARMLSKAIITLEVQRLLSESKALARTSAEKVLNEIANIAHVDIAEIFDEAQCLKPIEQIKPETRAAIDKIEVFEEYLGAGKDRVYVGRTKKITFHDKTKNLETLAKYFRLLSDHQPINNTTNIQVNSTTQNVYAKVLICLPPKKSLT